MIYLTLTSDERAAVQGLPRYPHVSPAERDRVEMVLLPDAGWSPPRIATHLGCHAKTVLLVLTRFRAGRAACAAARPARRTPSPGARRWWPRNLRPRWASRPST